VNYFFIFHFSFEQYSNYSVFAHITLRVLELLGSFSDFFTFSSLTLPKKTSGKSPQKDLMGDLKVCLDRNVCTDQADL